MDPVLLQQVPDEYKQIYQRHWNTIKTKAKQGMVKDTYHYLVLSNSNNEIIDFLRDTMNLYNRRFKINVAFGFILRNRITDDLRFYHPSNNTMLLKLPKLIDDQNDINKLIEEMEDDDILEYVRSQRPSTDWIFERIICARFDIYKMHV